MAARPHAVAHAARIPVDLAAAGLLALAVPAIFLHITYQPEVTIGLGSTSAGITLADAAVLWVAAAALVAGRRLGFEPLRAGRWIWLTGAAFLALVFVATFHPLLWQQHYRFATHLVTAAKFAEYGLLAVSLPLILRGRQHVELLLGALVAWSCAASAWGFLQFCGLVNEFEGKRPLQREPSFLGEHDFAALSGVSASVALAVLVLGPRSRLERRLAWAGAVAGAVGLVVSAAIAGALGLAAAVAALLVGRRRGTLTRQRTLACAGLAAVALVGCVTMRSGGIVSSLKALGINRTEHKQKDVASYAHRSLLAYIGLRIFEAHPVAGVGWQGSEEPENFRPYLTDAHRKFPSEPDIAFPSARHAWGVQNAYLQTLTDLGLVGFAMLAALFAAGLMFSARAALRAPPELAVAATCGLLWLLVAAGTWNGLGLVAGIPLDAVTWLAFGLAAAGAGWLERARA